MPALSTELHRRGRGITGTSSLVDELIEIQESYAETNMKSIPWVDNLKVLSVVSGRSNTFHERRLEANDMTLVRNYIAVSYSCEPTEEYESAEAGSYTIVNEDGSKVENTVRDVVLFRVRRFAEHVGSSCFWIDKECVKSWENQVAMDSMDRVYKGSQWPVGLLSTELHEKSHVLSLALLLNGGIVRSKGRRVFPAHVNCDEETQTNLLDLLELFQRDRWCRRAWIFQEEYLGGQRMMLIIRHTQGLEAMKRRAFTTRNGNEDWLIDGEICFPATLFREQTTIFLRAMCNSTNVSSALQERCHPLIDCFGKYNILYNEAESQGKAMSSMIFKDIASRDIKQPYDRLPITANCCDYGVRLDSESLAVEKRFADRNDVCALALFLLNGELIRNDVEEITEPFTAKSAAQYIDGISFCKFDPPIGTKQLTWLKDCRLPNVTFHQDGIHTVGLVWQVYDKFDITGWPAPRPRRTKRLEFGLDSFERDRLFQFADKLRKAEKNRKRTSSIPDMIEEYLDKDFSSQQLNEVKLYKDTMAREIVNVINEGKRPLSLAVLEGSKEGSKKAFAVFVGPQDKGARIFTSWSSGVDDNMSNRTQHVSLSVTLVNKRTPPLMEYTGWVNGLAFWQGHRQKKAVFCWPATWKQKSRKRKRGAE